MSKKNIGIEQNILGLLLDDGSRISECKLDVEDFSIKSHQVIFECIEKVISDNHAVDIVSVSEAIESNFSGEFVDVPYMADLIAKCAVRADNIGYFSEIIKNASELTKAKVIVARAVFDLDNDKDKKSVISETIKSLMALDKTTKKHEHTMKEAVIGAMEAYQVAADKGGLIGVTSGIKALDDALGGFHNSDLIILGARPAVGKTSLAINFANNADVPVGFASAEQPFDQIGSRFICLEGMVNSKNFRAAELTDFEYGRMPRTIENLKDKPIFFNDEPGMSIGAVVRQARRWKQERNIGILFVDYLQKLKGAVAGQNNIDRVTEVVLTLKELAKELNIPIVAISKVTRTADLLSEPPGMSHLSDASICEYEADTIITMYRDDDMIARGKTQLHIPKNRHGPTGDVMVDYQGAHFKFTDEQSYLR